jgi:hypothetical protein
MLFPHIERDQVLHPYKARRRRRRRRRRIVLDISLCKNLNFLNNFID